MYNDEEFKEKVINLYWNMVKLIDESFEEIYEHELIIIFNSISNLMAKFIFATIRENQECFLQKRLSLAKEFGDSICEIILDDTVKEKKINETV